MVQADEVVDDILTLLPEHGYDASVRHLKFMVGFLLAAGNAGDTRALVALGDIYVTGAYGVMVNVKDAKTVYRKAAEMGDKMAEKRLTQLAG